MISGLYDLARPMLLALEPERAHETTLRSLERGLYPRGEADAAALATSFCGLALPNPIGIAAGFDKDARVPDAILGMGFGFAEIGTVTPQPQAGNPRPRVFRLIAERALINRLGFNNAGHAAALRRLQARAASGVVGVNIGANKNTADRTADYVAGLTAFYDVAHYFTVNISSPNTPGLRDLQAPAALDALLGALMETRETLMRARDGRRVPLIVKLAPDIAEADLPAVVERLEAHRVDAIAVANTTLTRPGIGHAQAGGLSGRPLFHRATVMLARVYTLTGGRVPLVGIGGITDGASARAKIEAGASVIQIYTGLVYGGAGLLRDVKAALSEAAAGHADGLAGMRGRAANAWAAKPLDPA
ncbi:MAG: quinone-dependent dihydroorotate dehydrogenase [Pseudomonadota bacterium]